MHLNSVNQNNIYIKHCIIGSSDVEKFFFKKHGEYIKNVYGVKNCKEAQK